MKKKMFATAVICLIFAFLQQIPAEAGIRVKGKKEYLYSQSGKLLKNGFYKVEGRTCYVNKKGVIQKGWQVIKGRTYYFGKDGSLQTGWKRIGKKTYYFSRSKKLPKRGSMQTGWQKIRKKTYYFDKWGVLAKKTWVGQRYVNRLGEEVKKKKAPITGLEKKIREYIRNSCVPGHWAVYVKNLETGESLAIGNRPMYSACLIKIFGMGAVFEKIEEGAFSYNSVKGLLYPMITVSSNECFNTLVRKIGKSAINDFCREHGYAGTNQGKGIEPAVNAQGLENGTGGNLTTITDCGEILEDIYQGKLVSGSASKKMLEILKAQQLRSLIPSGVPAGIQVANKTGNTNALIHDAGIVFGKKTDYILCVMTDTVNAGAAPAGIRGISRIVYSFLN